MFVALLPVGAVLLGGGTAKWAEGIVIAFLGLYLLWSPPRRSLGWLLNSVLVAFVFSSAIAFLPTRFFNVSPWRKALTDDLGIILPGTATPQPWITVGCLISLIAATCWLFLVATQELELRGVRFQLRIFAAGVVLVALLSLALYYLHEQPPFWQNERGFGPFPNRNQTGDLFGIASLVILAAGQDDIRSNRKRWLLWLGALLVMIVALILNFSRAGIVILILGSALWIAAVALRANRPGWIALGASFLLLLAAGLLVFGGQTLARFHAPRLLGEDFRWRIFHDAWNLIRASPWCGIGLGNFEDVFAIFRQASQGNTRALHPESDWLWLWAEAGPFALLLVLAGVALFLRFVPPLQVGTNQRFRLAALIGALLFAAHGLVDVSAHRVGTAYAALLLFGLSLHRPLHFHPSRITPWLFRFFGLGLLLAGMAWVVSTRNGSLLPGAIGAANAKQQAEMANRGRNYADAINLTTEGLSWSPLTWELYYLRAVASVASRAPQQSAIDDFRRARFLEPNSYTVPLEEGIVWSGIRPANSFIAWREALRRVDDDHRREIFSRMFFHGAVANPNGRGLVEKLAFLYGDLTVAYLQQLPAPDFKGALQRYLEANPDLAALDEGQQRDVFSLWQQRGDPSALSDYVQKHRDAQALAWRALAQQRADAGEYRRACELMQQNIGAVTFPPTTETAPMDDLRRRSFRGTNDYAAGYALARAQERAGLFDDMLVTVRHFTDTRTAPSYFNYLEAQGWSAKGNWERSWKAWLGYEQAQSTNR